MRMEAHDFLKEATLGLALLALAIVGMQIDARSMMRTQAPAVLSLEKSAPFCKLDNKNEVASDQMCKVNFKKEVADGPGDQIERK